MRTMPPQKPGESHQNYETPEDFLSAVHARYGKPVWDLAASNHNAKAPFFWTEEQNSLAQDWGEAGGLKWINPPFSHIEPWAQKCHETSMAHNTEILLLVPASVGSNWFRDWVHGKAYVNFLNGRLTFAGCDTCYPKDCLLIEYGFNRRPGYGVWNWKTDKYNT